MPAMERPHRRHQSDDAVLRTRLPRLFLHPRNRSDSVHGVGMDAGNYARRYGALAIEVHQVCCDWLCAKLPQQRGDLSAVIRPMIDEMLHRFPEWIAVDAELQRFVFKNAL